jgi:hypothetical protein
MYRVPLPERDLDGKIWKTWILKSGGVKVAANINAKDFLWAGRRFAGQFSVRNNKRKLNIKKAEQKAIIKLLPSGQRLEINNSFKRPPGKPASSFFYDDAGTARSARLGAGTAATVNDTNYNRIIETNRQRGEYTRPHLDCQPGGKHIHKQQGQQ